MAEKVALFERELLERRERYNTAFALARRLRPRLDGELFLHNLRTLVAPIVEAQAPEKAPPLVPVLYDLCLELTGTELFSRSEAVCEVWSRLLVRSDSKLQQRPALLAASLTNAAYNLEVEGADWRGWLETMEAVCSHCSGWQEWLQVGQVRAWTAGLSHYREGALQVAESLPEALLLKVEPRWPEVVRDIWAPLRRRKLERPYLVHEVGGFLGFGGTFRCPPWVAHAGDGKFVVEDGTQEWVLCCDGFGATLKSGTDPEIREPAREDVQASEDGTLAWAGMRCRVECLEPVQSFAVSDQVLAVTCALSHKVFLFLGPGPAW